MRPAANSIKYYTNISTPYKSQQLSAWSRSLPDGASLEVIYFQSEIANNLWAAHSLGTNGISERWISDRSPVRVIRKLLSERHSMRGATVLIGGYYEWWHWLLLGLARCFARRVVLVFDGINPHRLGSPSGFRGIAKRIFALGCHAAYGNGRVSREFLTKVLHFEPGDIFEQGMVSQPESTQGFGPESVSNWRHAHHIPDGIRLVGFCGRLVERKRVQDLIEAFDDTRLSNGACLVIIGDGPYRGELERFARIRGISVRFIGAIPVREELFLALGALDLLVLPSIDEPWGMVVNEALSMGTPVVASDQCGCTWDFDRLEDAARVFPACDVGALRQVMSSLLESPPSRERVRELSERINCSERTSMEFRRFVEAMGNIRVLAYQPVVPPYRVPFFQGIRERRVELCIVCDQSESTQALAGIMHQGSVRSLGRQAVLWQEGISMLYRRRWDAVVIWGNPRVISNALILLAAYQRSIPSFWWGHLHTAGSPRWRLWWKRLSLRTITNRVLVYTLAERDLLIAEGMPPERVHGLNNTVDTTAVERERIRWSRSEVDEQLVSRWGLRRGYHLFTGRLTPKAGLSLVLDAMILHSPQARLVIVGDGVEAELLKEKVRRGRLEDRVRFLGEIYDEATLAPIFLGACSFVYPGSVGLSLLHAMAYGVPPIVHDQALEQMPEYAALKAESNGLTFQKDDALSLAEAMNRLDRDVELRDRLAGAAMRTVEEGWTMPQMVDRFVSAIESTQHRRDKSHGPLAAEHTTRDTWTS